MTELCEKQNFVILVFLAIFIHLTTTYEIMSLDDYKLCYSQKRIIKLGSDKKSGLIVTMGNLKERSDNKKFFCKFQLETAKEGDGIFAVIQQIVFRKNETTDDCIDFLQYKLPSQANIYSKKYCGRLSAALGMDPIFAPDSSASNLAPTVNSYIDPSGQLEVYISIDRERLQSYEEIELEIIFTAFKYCSRRPSTYLPCSSTYKDRCIFKDFFNDGFVNCPYPDCVDESGCSEEVYLEEKKSAGNKVIIGSVSLLLVVFVLFVCFVWMCRKYRKLCWAEEFANPANTNSNTRTIELSEPPTRDMPVSSGTHNIASGYNVPAIEEDKDLPPSYESLFPDR